MEMYEPLMCLQRPREGSAQKARHFYTLPSTPGRSSSRKGNAPSSCSFSTIVRYTYAMCLTVKASQHPTVLRTVTIYGCLIQLISRKPIKGYSTKEILYYFSCLYFSTCLQLLTENDRFLQCRPITFFCEFRQHKDRLNHPSFPNTKNQGRTVCYHTLILIYSAK